MDFVLIDLVSVLNRIYFTLSLGKHGEVLNIGLAERWIVVCDDHQLRLFTAGFSRSDVRRDPEDIF